MNNSSIFPPEPRRRWYSPSDLTCLRAMSNKGQGVSGIDPRSQVLFVLHHWNEDSWPHRETGYIDVPLDIQHKNRIAVVDLWQEVKNEVARRVSEAKYDGNVLLLVHKYGSDLEADAKEYGCSHNDLICDYYRALNYISTGHFESRPPYGIWCGRKQERARKGASARWLCLA